MLLKSKKIAIIGGGPGGLTLARLLQLKGANVQVYERDINKEARKQGATLDLHEESGLKAIKAAGLFEEFKNNYRPGADKLRVTDQNGKIYYDSQLENQIEDFDNEFFRPEIDRGPLRDILINSLKKDTIVWDSHFISMSQKNEGWQINFQNGNTVYADIVIASDGANSKIRPLLSNLKPIYSGMTIIEGNVYNASANTPKLNELLNGGKIFAVGTEKSLILSSKGDGSISFYTGTKEDEFWVKNSDIDFNSKSQVLDWFKKTFNDWDAIWEELFQNDEISFIPRPMYHFPLDQNWETQTNLTMIGDAAHRMPPYAGEGVNMAMLDALELSDCLTSNDFANIKSAIFHFEKEMIKRTSEVTAITLQSTEIFHSKNALQELLNMFNSFTN
jgi:2-polyprenyl-6-methoxyphenol hydroxylase-like FAD-dependent oxidoreductase